jgi:hypothetical protein
MRQIYEPAIGSPGVRALRWWYVGTATSARAETAPVRALRRITRRPAPTRSVTWAWMPNDLRDDARILQQLIACSCAGEQPARLPGLRWARGPMGVKLLDDGDHITYQTIANDLRHIADELDDIARLDRGDRHRTTDDAGTDTRPTPLRVSRGSAILRWAPVFE